MLFVYIAVLILLISLVSLKSSLNPEIVTHTEWIKSTETGSMHFLKMNSLWFTFYKSVIELIKAGEPSFKVYFIFVIGQP